MKEQTKQLWVILLIVFISFIGASIAYPIFPPLFLHPGSYSIIPDYWPESARSIFLGIALAVYPLGQFIGAPILGNCSDYYSRKKVLMLSLAGSIIGYLFTAISLYFQWLWVLIASRLLTGMMEGNMGVMRAMATDLDKINKYKSLGRINSAAAIGYIIGPLFGGLLSDKHLVSWFSYAFPFYLATVLSLLAILLTYLKLTDKNQVAASPHVSMLERFNLVKRFALLFKQSSTLKYLLIISTVFTFAVDIFYEFGPVYLTGLWFITPAGLALYNAVLCLSLSIGAGWLPHFLSLYFSTNKIIVAAMSATAIVFFLMVIYPSLVLSFILFGLVGFSISTVTTNMTVKVSNAADRSIQGEAMGAQLSLRTLGDAVICLIGGFLIISSFTLPILISFLAALIAAIIYALKCQKLEE